MTRRMRNNNKLTCKQFVKIYHSWRVLIVLHMFVMSWKFARNVVFIITISIFVTRYIFVYINDTITLTNAQFSKRFRKSMKKIVREFEKVERHDRFIFVDTNKRKKNARIKLKQWRRNHEYIQIIANNAQSTNDCVQIMTNQLNERLTKTNVRVNEFENELKNEKTKKLTLMKTYKNLKIKNEKLIILLLKRSAQVTINKRKIFFY